MNAAVGLEDEQTRIFNEIVAAFDQEEVVLQNLNSKSAFARTMQQRANGLALSQLGLCTIKVEVHIKTLEKLGDWILVHICLL